MKSNRKPGGIQWLSPFHALGDFWLKTSSHTAISMHLVDESWSTWKCAKTDIGKNLGSCKWERTCHGADGFQAFEIEFDNVSFSRSSPSSPSPSPSSSSSSASSSPSSASSSSASSRIKDEEKSKAESSSDGDKTAKLFFFFVFSSFHRKFLMHGKVPLEGENKPLLQGSQGTIKIGLE